MLNFAHTDKIMKNPFSKVAPYLSLILTFVMLFLFIRVSHHTGFREVLVNATQAYSSQMWLVILIFSCAFCFFAPGSLLSAVAYLIFGFWKTSFIISVASIMSSIFIFLIARSLFKQRVRNWIMHKPRLATIENALHDEGMYLYCLMRYIPIHFNMLVMMLAVSRIRFWQFFITCIALCPIWLLFTYFSHASNFPVTESSGFVAFLLQHGLQILFIGVTIFVIVFISVIAQRALTRSQA